MSCSKPSTGWTPVCNKRRSATYAPVATALCVGVVSDREFGKMKGSIHTQLRYGPMHMYALPTIPPQTFSNRIPTRPKLHAPRRTHTLTGHFSEGTTTQSPPSKKQSRLLQRSEQTPSPIDSGRQPLLTQAYLPSNSNDNRRSITSNASSYRMPYQREVAETNEPTRMPRGVKGLRQQQWQAR